VGVVAGVAVVGVGGGGDVKAPLTTFAYDVPFVLAVWASTCASASSSYDRSLHKSVITGVSCRRMGVSGWKMMEDRYSTI
jgi:hypothetical protein